MNKQYYNEMKLSEDKKRDMIKAIERGAVKRKKSYVGIIVPLFIAIATFLFVVSSQEGITRPLVNGTAVNLSDWTHESYFKELLILWTVSLVFLMTAYVQFLLLARNPERLREYRIFRKANEVYGTWRMVIIAAIPFIWIIVETAIILLFSSELVAQFFVVVLLLLNVMLIQLKFVKGRERAKCPHCNVELTTKEINFNKKCGVCGNDRARKVQTSPQEFFISFSGLIVMFFPFFQLSIIYVLLYAILNSYFTMVHILPYMVRFSEKEELPPPLW